MSYDIGEKREKTCETLRVEFAKQERAFQVAWRKAGNEDYAKFREVTSGEVSRMIDYYGAPKAKRISRKANTPITTPADAGSGNLPVPSGLKEKRSPREMIALYCVLIAATIASVYNLLRVCFEIADTLSAIVLTIVLSIAAVVFVAIGIRHRFTYVLVVLLIAFEAVCNMVRIYGGLMGWQKATPTTFLGTVCDIFQTGTHFTAVAIGALTACLIAGVQYASIFEINKSN